MSALSSPPSWRTFVSGLVIGTAISVAVTVTASAQRPGWVPMPAGASTPSDRTACRMDSRAFAFGELVRLPLDLPDATGNPQATFVQCHAQGWGRPFVAAELQAARSVSLLPAPPPIVFPAPEDQLRLAPMPQLPMPQPAPLGVQVPHEGPRGPLPYPVQERGGER